MPATSPALRLWLDNTRPHVAESTQFTSQSYIIPELRAIEVWNMQPAHIERFLSEMLSKGGRGVSGITQNTFKIMDTIIAGVLNDAVERGEISQSLMLQTPRIGDQRAGAMRFSQ